MNKKYIWRDRSGFYKALVSEDFVDRLNKEKPNLFENETGRSRLFLFFPINNELSLYISQGDYYTEYEEN